MVGHHANMKDPIQACQTFRPIWAKGSEKVPSNKIRIFSGRGKKDWTSTFC